MSEQAIPVGLAARIYAAEREVGRLQTLVQAETRRLAELVALAREITGASSGQQPTMQLVWSEEAQEEAEKTTQRRKDAKAQRAEPEAL